MPLTRGSITAVRQAIYQRLTSDVDLVGVLARTTGDAPAVYMGPLAPVGAALPYIHLSRPIADADDTLDRTGTLQLHDLRVFGKATAWEAFDDLVDHVRLLFHNHRLDLAVGGCISCLASGPTDLPEQPDGVIGSVVSLTVNARD